MMATAGVIGLATGKSLLGTSFYPSDLSERLSYCSDHGSPPISSASSRTLIVSKKSPNFSQNGASQNRQTHPAKALRDYVDAPSSTSDSWLRSSVPSNEDQDIDVESSTELLLLLQKSMLEKQWDLSISRTGGEKIEAPNITRTGMSARQRRTRSRRRIAHRSWTSPELLESRTRGYVRGRVSEDLLSHSEVVNLSKKIKAGLSIEEYKWKLKEKLGHEPSVKQLAMSLKIPHFELHSKMIEYSLAREKLAMSNVRLVMSIAQKYDNMGAEMPDLIQGGLIGLLRGIEKFDSSKGFRISTYVYWWIRQGVSRVLVENSKILRLPSHLHERLSSIRSAKILLEEKGVTPSIDKIAECLNMSTKKVRNATEAVSKVFSLDREAFPSLNGLPNETLHSYIADKRLENIPWHGIDQMSLKEEVRDLLVTTLNERERDIISLYYGLEEESRSWEDISRRIGLSRERVRQVGLVAMEKLKRAARRREMEAMLVKH